MKKDSPSDICWKLFEKTGNVNYYRLYKKLKDDDSE